MLGTPGLTTISPGGFTKSEADANLYHIVVEGKLLIIVLYVNDLILTGDEKLIKSCKEDIAREFDMKDLGFMLTFLVWKYGKEMRNYLSLRESMPTRYFRSFTWTNANPWRVL